jgi:hypothetical protein
MQDFTSIERVTTADGASIAFSRQGRGDPVLLVPGREIHGAPILDGLDEIERALPGARRAIVPGQWHMAIAFAPEAFAEIVASFLDSVD